MNFIKSFIPNLIFFFGIVIINFGNLFVKLGVYLHKKLNTSAGKQIISAEGQIKNIEEKFKELELKSKTKKNKGYFVDGSGGNA